MRILWIRHGDPDYEKDSLTEKGFREAGLLASRIRELRPGEIFVSPLGRAQATAACSLRELGQTAVTLPWLEEFPARVDPNLSEDVRQIYRTELKILEDGTYKKRIVWDMLPAVWSVNPDYFHPTDWRSTPVARCSDMTARYDEVCRSLDDFLAERGYVREGAHYRVVKGNEDTVTFFCHFGITAVLLSHLWNCSPFLLLQMTAAAPTSVTEAVTEEREKGIAAFRTLRIGDISHLTAAGEVPSFSARFCETWENTDQRH